MSSTRYEYSKPVRGLDTGIDRALQKTRYFLDMDKVQTEFCAHSGVII